MFEVIGERINTSRKTVQAAVAERDGDYIVEDVKKQLENYSSFLGRLNRIILIQGWWSGLRFHGRPYHY